MIDPKRATTSGDRMSGTGQFTAVRRSLTPCIETYRYRKYRL